MPERTFSFTWHAETSCLRFGLNRPMVRVPVARISAPPVATQVTIHQAAHQGVLAEALDVRAAKLVELQASLSSRALDRLQVMALLYRFLCRRTADAATLDAWLRLACLPSPAPEWRGLAMGWKNLPMLGEVELGRYTLMPWHREGREGATQLPLTDQQGVACYETLATAYWVARRHVPTAAQEPSVAVRQMVKAARQQAEPSQAALDPRDVRPLFPAPLWPDPLGALHTPEGQRYTLNLDALPDGEVFDLRLDARRPVWLRVREGRLLVRHAWRWEACVDPGLELGAALARWREQPNVVRVGPAGERLLAALGWNQQDGRFGRWT